jgi:dGTPase
LRLVEQLEYRYADFPGLNLSWEVLEAQAMHSKRPDAPEVKPYLNVGQPLLEAQVVDAADSLAYDCHDVDDALSVGLITPADLADVPFWALALERVRAAHAAIRPEQLQPAVIRKLIDWQVVDLMATTEQNLRAENIGSVDDVRRCKRILVAPSAEVRQLKAGLEAFLRERVYRHYRVLRMAYKGQRILHAMHDEFNQHPQAMPTRYAERAVKGDLAQTVCDYIAGMTDRFAQDEYLRLFHPSTSV